VTELNAQRWGEGAPRLFFIHGLGHGCFIWHHIVPSLAHLGAAMAVDLRGHGDSPRDPLETYAVQTHVLDVLATLRGACPEPVIVVGHSIGAEIALRVAAAQPGWVRRLVLVDGGPELDDAALEALRQQFSEQPWSYSTIEEYAQRLRQNLPLAAPPLLRLVAAQALRADSAGGFRLKCDRALVNCLGSKGTSIWPLFRAISIPMLAIRGAGSAILPRSVAVRMTRENPRCVLQSVPLAGHAVMLDNPLGLLSALRAGL
jgi:pimeloyl-ACP methyl ester carboxylesterase